MVFGLAGQRLGVYVVGRSQDRHEELGLRHLSCERIDDRDRLAGEVEEQILAGAVVPPEDDLEPACPGGGSAR